jgi:hypothetical protein
MIPAKKIEPEKNSDPARFEFEIPVRERFSVSRRRFAQLGASPGWPTGR